MLLIAPIDNARQVTFLPDAAVAFVQLFDLREQRIVWHAVLWNLLVLIDTACDTVYARHRADPLTPSTHL